MALPLALRNALVELVLASLHDADARRTLGAVVKLCAEPGCRSRADAWSDATRADFLETLEGDVLLASRWREHAAELRERSVRAWRAIENRPLDPAESSLESALHAARSLFDAGLYFEVHELLEPWWMRAEGADRFALQGLIQIAVGFEHLVNGNVKGGHALLASGSEKIAGRVLAGLDLDRMAREVRAFLASAASLAESGRRPFDRGAAPPFPSRR